MSDEIISFFKSASQREKKLEQDGYLFHEGDVVRYLYLVVEGEVQLARHQKDGATVVLQRAVAGSVIAEASVFSAHYHCDAYARTTTRVNYVTREDFLNRFRSDPDFAQAWATRLSREVQATRLRSEILSLKTVAQKLDAWIAWNSALPEKGEWNQIALQIGVSPEALYREMAKRRSPG